MPNFCESDKNYGLDYSNPIQEIYQMARRYCCINSYFLNMAFMAQRRSL